MFFLFPESASSRGFFYGGGKPAQKIEKRKEVETPFLLACAAACDSVDLAHFDGKAGRQLGKLESVASRGIRVLQRILRRVDPGVVFAKA